MPTNIEINILEMMNMVDSVNYSLDNNEGPVCLVYLRNAAEDDCGWQNVIQTLIACVPLHRPLATAGIVIIFDECPLPPVHIVLETVLSFRLCRELALDCFNSAELRCIERNRLVVLGCVADKFAGSSSRIFDMDAMNYFYTFLMDHRYDFLVLHALITLEKFCRSVENRTALISFFAKQAQSPLLALEQYCKHPDPMYKQIGFIARWLLDNIFHVPGRALSYTTMDMSRINAILDIRDTTDFLKISSDGLQVRCDSPSFEHVRCTYRMFTGCWYYEVEILTPGVMQIGWAAKETKFTMQMGEGNEDDHFTVAYDGCRRTFWNNTAAWLMVTVNPWTPGDILGCFIDVAKQEAFFTLNGVKLRKCISVFESERPTVANGGSRNRGFYAAASLMCFQALRFNFGLHKFRYAPVNREFNIINNHGTLTAEEKQILPRRIYIDRINALEAERDEDIEDLCFICYDRKTETTAAPCHHMRFCYVCAARLSKCPVCRKAIWMTNVQRQQ